MGNGGKEPQSGARAPRPRPRYVFQVDSSSDRTVLRVMDTTGETVFREIPIEEFLEYARHHKNVTPWLLSQLPSGAHRPAQA